MQEAYLTLAAPATSTIEVKRSVFRCELTPVSVEEDARAVVDGTRKTLWDARHHCSAFVLGPDAQLRRSSDDGEPSGTAGMPMLDVLLGAGLTDVVAVVSRWFGGTLLGTGGLVKAYGDAVREAVSAAKLVRYERHERLRTTVHMANVGKVEHGLRASGFAVLDVSYVAAGGLEPSIEIAAPASELPRASSILAELTAGQSTFTPGASVWVAV